MFPKKLAAGDCDMIGIWNTQVEFFMYEVVIQIYKIFS